MSIEKQSHMIFIKLGYSSKASSATYSVSNLFWVCTYLDLIYINMGCAKHLIINVGCELR